MSKIILYVQDFYGENDSDSDAIDNCLVEAKKFDSKTIIFDKKNYYIDRAVTLSSNTEIIIDDCTIKQNNYIFDNIFRGDNVLAKGIDPYGVPFDVFPLENIKIIGKNNAKIVGPDKVRVGYHHVWNEYQKMVGDLWGWRTLMCCFSNCKNIEISNISISQTMSWAISFDNCQNVYVHDIDIRSDVKNGDGIDFRSGCNHCLVENITGFTSDDTVACTALAVGKSRLQKDTKYLSVNEPFNYSRDNIDASIHDIIIRNIKTGGFHHGVICLSAFGNQLYNIDISDVVETDEGEREATIKIYTGYGDGYNKGDIRNINISNVESKIAKYALMIDCEPVNVKYENIVQKKNDGAILYNLSKNPN